MKKYYLHNEKEQQGPFDIEDLKAKNINSGTSIWHDGLSEWTTAGEVEDLKELFKTSTPPPFVSALSKPPPVINTQAQQPKSDIPLKSKNKFGVWKVIQIIAGLFLGGLLILFLIDKFSNNSSVDGSGINDETYQETAMTIEEYEKSQPTKFLTADGNYNQNFWGNKIKVHGVVKNIATIANYKDAVVRITYYSATKTELGSKEYTVYKVFPPHSEVNFELKIENYKDVSKIGWEVIHAETN